MVTCVGGWTEGWPGGWPGGYPSVGVRQRHTSVVDPHAPQVHLLGSQRSHGQRVTGSSGDSEMAVGPWSLGLDRHAPWWIRVYRSWNIDWTYGLATHLGMTLLDIQTINQG